MGILLTGCTNTGSSLASKDKVASDFLKQFFTSDYEGRYTQFIESVEQTSAGGEDELALYEAYFDSFSNCTTAKCRGTMAANRIPYSYDKSAFSEGYTIEVVKSECSFQEDSSNGEFEVRLKTTKNGEITYSRATGQIGVQSDEKGGLVDTIYITSMTEES